MNNIDKTIDAIIPIKNNSVKTLKISEVIKKATLLNFRCIVILDGFNNGDVLNFKKTLGQEIDSEMIVILSGVFNSPGFARNAGIEISSSKWITFWDADDFPNPEAIAKALEIYGSEQIPIIGQFQINSINTKTENISDVAINPGIWRILFPRNTITKHRFSDRLWGEDQLFIVQTGLLIDNTRIVPDYFYNYKTGISGQLTQNNRSVNEGIKSLIDIFEYNSEYRGSNKNLKSQLIPIIKISGTILKRFIFLDNKLISLWHLFKINFLTFIYFKKDYVSAIYKVMIKAKKAK